MGLKAGAGFFTFIQMNSEELLIADVQSALDFIMTIKFETDCTNIAINREAIVEDFFVLSTSKSLNDFIYECNKGRDIYFQPDVSLAVDKLSA